MTATKYFMYIEGDQTYWYDDEDERGSLEPYVTHEAEEIDRRERPDDDKIDEDGKDEEGTYWGEWSYICNFTFAPITGAPT